MPWLDTRLPAFGAGSLRLVDRAFWLTWLQPSRRVVLTFTL